MMKKLIKIIPLLLATIFLFGYGCQPERDETPTKGKLKCYVDESLFPLVTALRDSFQAKYPQTKIELLKVKAREGIVQMLNGESTMFISSRGFTDEENKFYIKTKSQAKTIKMCYDAITVIVDSNHALNEITVTELKQLLKGESKQYKVYVPDQNSGMFENVKNSLLDNNNPKGAYVVASEEEVIKKVLKDKKAIGIVGLNMAKTHSGLKIIKIGTDEISSVGGYYYEPIPGYLSNGDYPLIRSCYIFLNEIGILVGNGFATFITSYVGQKIVLEQGLGPATVPIKYKQTTRLR